MSIRYPADLPITARRGEIAGAIRGNWVLDLATEMCSEGSQRDRHFISGAADTAETAAVSSMTGVSPEDRAKYANR